MLNLVDKYSAEAATTNEDGVVAIEYVLVAGFVFIGVGVVFAVGPWDALAAKLEAII